MAGVNEIASKALQVFLTKQLDNARIIDIFKKRLLCKNDSFVSILYRFMWLIRFLIILPVRSVPTFLPKSSKLEYHIKIMRFRSRPSHDQTEDQTSDVFLPELLYMKESLAGDCPGVISRGTIVSGAIFLDPSRGTQSVSGIALLLDSPSTIADNTRVTMHFLRWWVKMIL